MSVRNLVCFLFCKKSFFYNAGVGGQAYICRDYQSQYNIQ
ncbi:hypothetical protein M068_2919 [Bacteroides fragilis str. J38-1]|nr:hypothetical protein M068_2919 [Bacteroides fragilis str. J38-1]